jgi:hypothetical protein
MKRRFYIESKMGSNDPELNYTTRLYVLHIENFVCFMSLPVDSRRSVYNCSMRSVIDPIQLEETGTILYIAPANVRTYRYPSGPTCKSVIPPSKPVPKTNGLASSGV